MIQYNHGDQVLVNPGFAYKVLTPTPELFDANKFDDEYESDPAAIPYCVGVDIWGTVVRKLKDGRYMVVFNMTDPITMYSSDNNFILVPEK